MGRKIWKRQMQFLSILIDSYSIKLEIDIKTIQKLASNIKYYLNKSGIKYQSSENEYENGSLNYSYHRQDNSHSMIEIDKFKRNVKISIFCREFDNKKNALELKKMIWDENEKSNKI